MAKVDTKIHGDPAMLKYSIALLALVGASLPANADEHLVAIDVLLISDRTMLDMAADWNARMREQTREGFELDETHRPHVTLIQRHVAAGDLDAVLEAVAEVSESFDVGALTMTADGLYHIPTGVLGLAGITIERTPALLELQGAVVEAVDPFDAGAGDESAYVPDPSGTPFDQFLFDYVETFVPQQTGDMYNPHVTIGVAPTTWIEKVESQPFDTFEFGATDIAVYQWPAPIGWSGFNLSA